MLRAVLSGLRHNITMTIAMVLTTAMSLTMLGGGLIIARMADQMKEIFGDKVEVTVYLTMDQTTSDPNCLEELCRKLADDLRSDPAIAEVRYESQDAAFERYQQMFAEQRELLEIGSRDALPASFHVAPTNPERYEEVASTYGTRLGVEYVSDQAALIQPMFDTLNRLRTAAMFVALLQAVAAFLLISNMVQVAAFTRREETEIMRLVGASRWRTQFPFVIEAVVAGLLGALGAIGLLVGFKLWLFEPLFAGPIAAGIIPPIDSAAILYVAPIVGVVGAGLAAISAYITLRLYVRT
jgi:cell division transport system permease protein